MIRRAAFGLAALVAAGPVLAETVTAARFEDETDRYAHGILGDALEWGSLVLTTDAGRDLRIELPQSRVFEDLAPRLADLDGDGAPEVIVVETSLEKGARLSVYGPEGLVAATPFIGRSNRWLAPLGAADLDGDGLVEIAYVDRPHLAKILMIWRFEDGALHKVAELAGLSNHRIGASVIEGGITECDGVPTMILANGDWSRVTRATYRDDKLTAIPGEAYDGPETLDPAKAGCQPG